MFVMVTSEVSCGKTTALRRFRDSLDKSAYVCLYLSDSRLQPRWLYNGMLEQLDAEQKFYRGDARRLLHQHLAIIRAVNGKRVVTTIDESHLLERDTLEDLRFLPNYNMDSQNHIALILAGQSELWDKLNKQAYAAIRLRIDLKREIPQLDRAQCEQCVTTHLDVAEGR